MTVVQFPITQTERMRQWDAAAYDLGECVHSDCDQPAMFYLLHYTGRSARIDFRTGEEALRMLRAHEAAAEGYEELYGRPQPLPTLVCGDCAMGALAAVIAYGI